MCPCAQSAWGTSKAIMARHASQGRPLSSWRRLVSIRSVREPLLPQPTLGASGDHLVPRPAPQKAVQVHTHAGSTRTHTHRLLRRRKRKTQHWTIRRESALTGRGREFRCRNGALAGAGAVLYDGAHQLTAASRAVPFHTAASWGRWPGPHAHASGAGRPTHPGARQEASTLRLWRRRRAGRRSLQSRHRAASHHESP